ncbi:Pre-rRNA-processing protein ipi1 [Endocarpon pusillum Z07020]|uniref:Pre-rRNA-processing protein n=1 Tax=Endocarpon pusillum (strain Z07020 / HMAS-L-300199) TaxID=1263415 RepID=U1GDN5_ENDPU|nr:Pre-rRNA-processing protein ipi1 [Endocarpon pusillum Z07020]ERF70173.1 Pre-rRNA-processing protein ipi1 [Endocarpon pusillum Z07020]
MGSSAKKKREKKKDFQKPKLKVGKARPKAANHTETSFRSKAIVLNQQSLHIEAPSTVCQFGHHLSLLSSRADAQRRDSLAYLTSFVTSRPVDSSLPQPLSTVLPKIFPLILDGSNGVRQQTLRLLRALPRSEMSDHVAEILPYIRAGMTHLAADIRLFSVEVLAWSTDIASDEVVSCAGGWVKTLNCFLTLLGWHNQDSAKWSTNRVSFGKAGSEGKAQSRNLQVLADFLKAGFSTGSDLSETDDNLESRFPFPRWHPEQHGLPTRSNAYGYLNLFGPPKDDDTDMLEDREDRIRVFKERFASSMEAGLASARKDAGEVGRATGLVTKALKDTEAG